VVPAVSGLMVTYCMSPRMRAIPRPRSHSSAGRGGCHEPLSVMINYTWSPSAVAAKLIVPSVLWR
jgi:hypothetical protein